MPLEQILKGLADDAVNRGIIEDDITSRDLFALDSSNIQPEEWKLMADAVKKSVEEGFDAVVITHGTDTLAYTASMLSFILRGVPIPVVLTGSQYPIAYPDSDGKQNLTNAIIAARALPGGVYVDARAERRSCGSCPHAYDERARVCGFGVENVVLAGDGAAAVSEAAPQFEVASAIKLHQRAASVALAASLNLKNGISAESLVPTYLRLPQAERLRRENQNDSVGL